MKTRAARGNALLIAILVVLIISIMGVGLIRYAQSELAGATATSREQALVACAEAARQQLMANAHLLAFTNGNLSLTPLNQPLGTNGTRLLGGHYDTPPAVDKDSSYQVQIVQMVPLASAAFGAPPTVRSPDNQTILNLKGGTPWKVVVHCQDGSAGNRVLELEFGINYGG